MPASQFPEFSLKKLGHAAALFHATKAVRIANTSTAPADLKAGKKIVK